MEATQAPFLSLLDGKKQFIIPIYQRTYSWQYTQCEKLFKDILAVGQKATSSSHFVGSVVYFLPDPTPTTSVPQYLVIDGQQRLTTIVLILLSIVRFLKHNPYVKIEDETWEEIFETYLVNKHRTDNTKYKLLLTRHDRDTLIRLSEIENYKTTADDSIRISENFTFLSDLINTSNVTELYQGIKKLVVVDVILERGKDNPQLIFESLNSTGLDLSQADLIRNYILMGQAAEKQEELYNKYWFRMEQDFGDQLGYLPWFIRDYVTMKTGTIPNAAEVYESYKRFLSGQYKPKDLETAAKELFTYSTFYCRIVLSKERIASLNQKFREIQKLRIETCYPLLLSIYYDFEQNKLSIDDFLEILSIIRDYVFRRVICGLPTNSLNKIFASIYSKVDPDSYLISFKAAFLLMDGQRRFPKDDEFSRELKIKDIYNLRARNYLLECLENYKRKEPVNIENFTIEHIMPQNKNFPNYWRTELGTDWENIKDKYLHTLGNLTLTSYNSELSDRPFSEKKTIGGGFNSSPLNLNESVREAVVWNEDSIVKRADKLVDLSLQIWKYPSLPKEVLGEYSTATSDSLVEDKYSVSDYEYLKDEILDLYRKLEKRILNIDSSVHIEFKKKYIAFKSLTNFCDVIPQKAKLRLTLNMKFEKVIDPKGICKNIEGLGRWGNGDVEVGLDLSSDLDYVLELIEQSLNQQLD
ncbi:MAG: DUF262 domain-containing protein [Bacteroidetes bacterium]|nr:DUF262 domain-containing protein [Bacteroidota bacterium]